MSTINPYYNGYESGGFFLNSITRDIEMVRGDTMSFAFQVQGLGDTVPSGVQFTCKQTAESSSILFAVSLDDHITIRDYDSESDTYTFVVRVPPESTYSLSIGRYFYDLEIQVNYDVFTILRGRLELLADITRGNTPPTPTYDSGDNEQYPQEDIALGTIKLYTEQTISDIAENINDILDSSTLSVPADLINKLGEIKTDIASVISAVNTVKETSEEMTLSQIPSEILEINPPFTPLKNSKTNLWITVDADTLTVDINFKQSANNGTVVNFGDGTGDESVSGTGSSMKTITHTYSQAGSYVISISVADGTTSLGYSQSKHLISGSSKKHNTILQYAEIYHDLNSYAFEANINLKKVAFERAGLTIGDYIFSRCASLNEIKFDEPSLAGAYFVYYTGKLEKITLNATATAYSSNCLGYSLALKNITLSDNVEQIPSGMFRDCPSLESLTFPSGITSINSGAFNNCNNLREFHMLGSTPPTLSGAITSIVEKVYIPTGSLSNYQGAQYWADCTLIEE